MTVPAAPNQPHELPARYVDGQRAEVVPVTVALGVDALRFTPRPPGAPEVWFYDELCFDAEPPTGTCAVSPNHAPDAQLRFDDPTAVQVFAARVPSHTYAPRRPPSRSRAVVQIVASFAAIVLVIVGFRSATRPIARALPTKVDAQLGRAVMGSLLQNGADITTPEFTAAILPLVTRLAGKEAAAYHVHLLQTPVVNAFAAPGGHVVLFCGIIRNFHSPDEFSGVLAHEMAHVRLRHGTETVLQAVGVSLVMRSLLGDATGLSETVRSALPALMRAAYSRQAEQEADDAALASLRAAGLRDDGLSSFFARRSAEEGISDTLSFLSTHPSSASRAARAQDGDTTASGAGAFDETTWMMIQDVCAP